MFLLHIKHLPVVASVADIGHLRGDIITWEPIPLCFTRKQRGSLVSDKLWLILSSSMIVPSDVFIFSPIGQKYCAQDQGGDSNLTAKISGNFDKGEVLEFQTGAREKGRLTVKRRRRNLKSRRFR